MLKEKESKKRKQERAEKKWAREKLQ